MKKIIPILVLISSRVLGADAAYDLILTQRKDDNSGPIQRNVAPAATSVLGFDSSKHPLNYTTTGSGTVIPLANSPVIPNILGNSSTGISVGAPPISAPSTPLISNQGTPGSTSYSYEVAAILTNGMMTQLSAAGTTTTGAAVLNGTNFNRLTWSAYPGALEYVVYRTASSGTPSSIGLLDASSNPLTATTLDDVGLEATVNIPIPTGPGTGLLNCDILKIGPTSDAQHDYESRFLMTGDMTVNGSIRAQNQDNFVKGHGVEIQYVPVGSSAFGLIHAIDRDGAVVFHRIIMNHGSHDPSAQIIIGDGGSDNTHLLKITGSIYSTGFDAIGGTSNVTKTGGGEGLQIDSNGLGGVYLDFGTTAGTKALIGCGDVVYGGSVNELALNANSGKIILCTAGTPRIHVDNTLTTYDYDISVSGTATFNGSFVLNSQFNSQSVVPQAASSYNLGSGAARYANIYGDSLYSYGLVDTCALFIDGAKIAGDATNYSFNKTTHDLTITGALLSTTVKVLSGSNKHAGTFTLSSGSATVSNTSVTTNSVVCCTVKTSSGTLGTGTPEIVVTAGTGFTATGVATDNSTYNFVIFEVN